MPVNPANFLLFLARHYRPVEALCRQRLHFTSDDEIAAFLQPFMDTDTSPTRLISQMKELGILVPGTEDWSPPGYLARFLGELQNRHVLASPQVIQGWIAKLQGFVTQLEKCFTPATVALDGLDLELLDDLLHEIGETFRVIADTVHGNCDCIAAEVADYRKIEDAQNLRRRLARLVSLHDEFLQPVIRIIDITEDFQAVTERIATCCAKISALAQSDEVPLGDDARRVRHEIVWLRRSIIQRAEESKRELAPLCEAAVRESKIAIGVNRALEAIRQNQIQRLDLEGSLPILEDFDGTLLADSSIERYLRLATQFHDVEPPEFPSQGPQELSAFWTTRTLLNELDELEKVDDLMLWLRDRCGEAPADEVVGMLVAVLEARPHRVRASTKRRDYALGHINVDAHAWRWERVNGNA